MPDTIVNVVLPINTWIDLYDITGIVVGTRISVQNVGSSDVRLAVAATEPAADFDGYNVIIRSTAIPYANASGDSGAWALCRTSGGKVNVTEVV